MDDKIILILLFNNNILRANLQGYEDCVCTTEVASNLVKVSTRYFKEKTKALNVTQDDLDIVFNSEFAENSEEFLPEPAQNDSHCSPASLSYFPAYIKK